MPLQADTCIVKNPDQCTCLEKKQQQQQQQQQQQSKSTEITIEKVRRVTVNPLT